MARMEIITGPDRRRSWSEERKRAIVAASFAVGAIVADVARRVSVYAGQIYRWRQELGDTASGFSQIVIAAVDGGNNRATKNRATLDPALAIEIEFTGAARLCIPALTPPNWRRGGQSAAPMIPIRTGVRVWIATGHTDMRRA